MPYDPERAAFLRRRNELWRRLRELEPDDEQAEAIITELSGLIGWSREKILEGLGWP